MRDIVTNERPGLAKPDPKRPYHVGVAIGLTTGVYALSLVAAASMQIETDRALIADRSPVQAAIQALGHHHDLMESHLLEARLQYTDGSAGYTTLAERLAALDARLAASDKSVSDIERLSARLPTEIWMPDLPGTTPRSYSGGGGSVGSAPSRGSSGGGSSGGTVPSRPAAGGGGSSGGSAPAVKPPPALPPVAAPPARNGSTGASGAP